MKIILTFFVVLSFSAFGQELTDTLFYKSGRVRPVNVIQVSKNTLEVKAESNGKIFSSQIKMSSLKGYYRNQDSSYIWFNAQNQNAVGSELESDTINITVRDGFTSISPLGLALAGLSLDFHYKGGSNLNHAFCMTGKAISFWGLGSGFGTIGFGYAYHTYVSTSLEFYLFAQPRLYFLGGTSGAFMIGFGGVSRLNNSLGFNFNVSGGPTIGSNSPFGGGVMLDLTVGLAFGFGNSRTFQIIKSPKK